MPFRIMLLHIGEKDVENSQELIHQMKTIGNLVPAEDGTEDVTIPNSELLVHISDATRNTGPGEKPVISAKSGRGAGAILMYDTTRRETFGICAGWIKAFQHYACKEAVVLLVADRSNESNFRKRAISYEEGRMLAEKGGLYCEVNTQNPHSAKEALNNLVMRIYDKLEKGRLGTGPKQGVKLVLGLPARRHSTSCASPTTPTNSLKSFPRRGTMGEMRDSIPELETQRSLSDELESMRELCDVERAKQASLQDREQELLRDNSALHQQLATAMSKLETLRCEKTVLETEKHSLTQKLAQRENEQLKLNEQVTGLQQMCARLQSHHSSVEQEKAKLSQALTQNAEVQWRLQQELTLKNEALENERQAHARTYVGYREGQLRVDNLLEQLKQRPTDINDSWRIPRSEVVVREARTLGRGAWGFVAEGEFRGKTVAVKCLHEEIVARQTLERVHREIRTMAQVRHPNIVLFIAAVLDDQGPPLIVSELLDSNLRAAYTQKFLNGTEEKMGILRGVACALNYLHKLHEPIIHRDISAPNVLLAATRNGKWIPKVSDFGSANLASRSHTLGEGAIIYAAPETFPKPSLHNSHPQTTKIDVYSFGILTGEALMEELPDPDSLSLTLQYVAAQWPQAHRMMVHCIKQNPNERPDMATVISAYLDPVLAAYTLPNQY